jgi:hypothetical protein
LQAHTSLILLLLPLLLLRLLLIQYSTTVLFLTTWAYMYVVV